MYNRYVEWRYALKEIISSPIIGHGFGATFWDYNWVVGFSERTGYIHNAGLAILLKSGLVGLILLLIPCIGYFLKGLQYLKSTFLTAKEKAYLRASIATMLFIVIMGYTTPVFLQRDESIYIALYWCFIISIEHEITERQKFSSLTVKSE